MGKHLKDCTIYAVDFDGTLCESKKYPDIGAPNEKLIEWLIEKQKSGDKVILWTNRVGKFLDAAVKWSNERGLFFDAVNENLPEIIKLYLPLLDGCSPSPKITADIFIDDSACGEGLPFTEFGCRRKCSLDDCWNEYCLCLRPHNVDRLIRNKSDNQDD